MTDRCTLLEELLQALVAWSKDPSSVAWRPVQKAMNELAKDAKQG